MTRIGYARVSTTDQDLTLQREALTERLSVRRVPTAGDQQAPSVLRRTALLVGQTRKRIVA
jgi:DNA invertase Pin-like site-specific DNA recombinase